MRTPNESLGRSSHPLASLAQEHRGLLVPTPIAGHRASWQHTQAHPTYRYRSQGVGFTITALTTIWIPAKNYPSRPRVINADGNVNGSYSTHSHGLSECYPEESQSRDLDNRHTRGLKGSHSRSSRANLTRFREHLPPGAIRGRGVIRIQLG